jgi:hypothetical protein
MLGQILQWSTAIPKRAMSSPEILLRPALFLSRSTLAIWHKFGTVGGESWRSQAKAGDTNCLILQDSGEARP